MSKIQWFIAKFDKHSEYEVFTGTSEFILPNVSLCEQENEVHYNQMTESEIAFINPTTTVEVGNSVTNTVTVIVGDGAITYSSSDTAKATVDANGTVTAIGGGNVTITATISETDTYLSAETSYELTVEVPTLCVLTLNDGSVVNIEGRGELTSATTRAYSATCVSAEITNNCTSLGVSAFRDFSGLTEVTIPNSVTSLGVSAFTSCSGLTEVTIPNSVTSIGIHAFGNCTSLSSVTIPDGVTSIGNSAFYYCTSLSSVTIPNSVTSIENQAFYECRSLSSVDIPNSVTSIGNYAFNSCSSLSSVTIGNSVTSIGGYTFGGCKFLSSIASNAITAPTIAYNTFQSVKSGGTLYVPQGSTGYDVWMAQLSGWTMAEQ